MQISQFVTEKSIEETLDPICNHVRFTFQRSRSSCQLIKTRPCCYTLHYLGLGHIVERQSVLYSILAEPRA